MGKIEAAGIKDQPDITVENARAILLENYSLQATSIRRLSGERDLNHLVEVADGRKFIFKIAGAQEQSANLDLQNKLFEHLARHAPDLPCQQVIPTQSGQHILNLTGPNQANYLARLLTYLPGTLLADIQPHSLQLIENLGRFLAQIDNALTTFSHPAAHRPLHWRATEAAGTILHYIDAIPDHADRTLVRHFLNRFQHHTLPRLTTFRQSVIQNDANDYNILVSHDPAGRPFISGLIDFGDTVHAPTICELAVAAAYIILDKNDILPAASALIKGYNQKFPLLADELSSLYELISLRLALSVTISAYQKHLRPYDPYLSVSENHAWQALKKLVGLDPLIVENHFRAACGLPPHPGQKIWSKADNLSLRKAHLGPSLSISYQEPLKILLGFRQYLYDENGRRYLDCVNNVAHVGHSHPTVVEAGQRQMALLNTNTRYLHDRLAQYAQRLTATFPDPLNVCYFVCSGSEANELALRLAQTYTGRKDILVVDGAYHGNTAALVNISPYKFNGPGGQGQPDHVHIAPMPDGYRGPYKGQSAETGQQYASHVAEIMKSAETNGRPIAAFICESLLGCGGQIVLPDDYLPNAFAAVRAAGGLCIADEVQVGFGRVGRSFWGFQLQNIIPDIVTLGKPIGNGHPLAAVITTPEIAAAFANGMEYFNTFGGNPVSCAIGLAVLDVIEEENLQQNALEVGSYLLTQLRTLQAHQPLIGDVRGEGLFIGIELIRSPQTRQPAPDEAAALIEAMKNRGILLSTDGPHHNVIKIKPPLPFTKDDADLLVEELSAVLFGTW